MKAMIAGLVLPLTLLSSGCASLREPTPNALSPHQATSAWRECAGNKGAVVISRATDPVDVLVVLQGESRESVALLQPGERRELSWLPQEARYVWYRFADRGVQRPPEVDVRYTCTPSAG